jgi:hypothetical protein
MTLPFGHLIPGSRVFDDAPAPRFRLRQHIQVIVGLEFIKLVTPRGQRTLSVRPPEAWGNADRRTVATGCRQDVCCRALPELKMEIPVRSGLVAASNSLTKSLSIGFPPAPRVAHSQGSGIEEVAPSRRGIRALADALGQRDSKHE